MLVLGRHQDGRIIIGPAKLKTASGELVEMPKVEIVVVDIRGDKVRLGIEAPPEIPVHRKEVYDAIERANQVPA